MFNTYQFNASRFAPSAVAVQVLTDSISIVKVSAGVPASVLLAAQDTLAGLGNRIIVGPTTKLSVALTAVATTIQVAAAVFANGDTAVMQTAVAGVAQTEYFTITSASSGTGPFTYNVTRNVDGSGANSWSVGDVIVSLGQTGNSFIDIYSVIGLKSGSEVGPSVVGNVRNSSTYNDWTTRWALGNLNGVFGYATNIYGVAFGVPTGAWVKIDPTNGVRIGFNATTNVQIDASGNASFTGAITAASGTIGGWTIGATSLTAGSGANTVGIDSGGTNPAFYAGSATPASAPFNVTKAGVLTASSGTVGGWTLAATSLTAGTGANTVGVDSGGTNPVFYAGSATPGSAPFRVSKSGALTSTSGTIGGLSISSGGIAGSNFTISASGIAISSGSFSIGGFSVNTSGNVGITGNISATSSACSVLNLTANGDVVSTAGGLKGSYLQVGVNQVVGAQGAAVANATNATDVITQLNALLARLRTHGLIAT